MESVRTDRLEDTEILFILVRAGLWEKVPENLSLFPRSSESWERIFNLAQRQTVTGSSIRDCASFRTNCFHPNSNCFIGWQPLTGSKEPISG